MTKERGCLVIPAMIAIIRNPLVVSLLAAAIGAQASAPDAMVSAIGKARKDNQRVLLVVGDGGIRAQLSELSRLILYEYVVVELAVDSAYGEEFRPAEVTGPFLAILDDQYHKLAAKAVAALPATAVTEKFLIANQADYLDAGAVYADALSLAKQTNRQVFVHLSAPW